MVGDFCNQIGISLFIQSPEEMDLGHSDRQSRWELVGSSGNVIDWKTFQMCAQLPIETGRESTFSENDDH
jgi:hypothetical protein